ncbi:MAG: hypothetical protein E6Q97_33660 [Desulfurellales bacterium]|nr:MAG: hypothetical protein E6Q97_33660 [Desulfurellales bacterium]
MAIKNCSECNGKVSDQAEKCPHCGATLIKKSGCITQIVAGILALTAIAMWNNLINPPPPKTQEQIRKEGIEQYFDPFTGEHRALTNAIKQSLNDPESYSHDKTLYIENGGVLFITTTFRARNKHGGMSSHEITATTDLQGNVIEIKSHRILNKL